MIVINVCAFVEGLQTKCHDGFFNSIYNAEKMGCSCMVIWENPSDKNIWKTWNAKSYKNKYLTKI